MCNLVGAIRARVQENNRTKRLISQQYNCAWHPPSYSSFELHTLSSALPKIKGCNIFIIHTSIVRDYRYWQYVVRHLCVTRCGWVGKKLKIPWSGHFLCHVKLEYANTGILQIYVVQKASEGIVSRLNYFVSFAVHQSTSWSYNLATPPTQWWEL